MSTLFDSSHIYTEIKYFNEINSLYKSLHEISLILSLKRKLLVQLMTIKYCYSLIFATLTIS